MKRSAENPYDKESSPLRQNPVQMYLNVSTSNALNQWLSSCIWRYFFNGKRYLSYLLRSSNKSSLASKVEDSLRNNGYFVTSVDELGCREIFEEKFPVSEPFMDKATDIGARLPSRSIFELEPLLSDLKEGIDRYCRLDTSLWHGGRIVHPQQVSERKANANWHVDREDFHVLKVFIFLSNIDEQSGATEYIKGSNPSGPLARLTTELAKQGIPKGVELYDYVDEGLLQQFIGTRGQVCVFDARGLHRGGFVSGKGRDVAFLTYASSNWIHSEDAFIRYNAEVFELPSLIPRVNNLWRKVYSRLFTW